MLDVLIVDDSAAIRKILQRVLRQTDLPIGTVYEANDGAEALEALKTQTVGLILSDINMPNMDGIEFLTKVRADDAWKNLPIASTQCCFRPITRARISITHSSCKAAEHWTPATGSS